MLLPIPPLRRRRPRRSEPGPLVPPGPVAVQATVTHMGGQWFIWFFDTPFANPAVPLTAADFAGLWVAGNPPVAVDEVIGGEGSLTLIYDLQDPDAPGLQYEVVAAPAVLHFDGGKPLAVPQNGFVSP